MNIKKATTSTKKFVQKHRVAIAIVGTATACAALQIRNAKILNEFLKEHDLYEEYYEFETEE